MLLKSKKELDTIFLGCFSYAQSQNHHREIGKFIYLFGIFFIGIAVITLSFAELFELKFKNCSKEK